MDRKRSNKRNFSPCFVLNLAFAWGVVSHHAHGQFNRGSVEAPKMFSRLGEITIAENEFIRMTPTELIHEVERKSLTTDRFAIVKTISYVRHPEKNMGIFAYLLLAKLVDHKEALNSEIIWNVSLKEYDTAINELIARSALVFISHQANAIERPPFGRGGRMGENRETRQRRALGNARLRLQPDPGKKFEWKVP